MIARRILILRCLVCVNLCAAAFQVSVNAQTVDRKVLYTGKLFGYYTKELSQREVDVINGKQVRPQGCAVPSDPMQTSRVTLLLDEIHNSKRPGDILVGMGDNFAPQLEATLSLYERDPGTQLLVPSVCLAAAHPEYAYPLKRLAARPGGKWGQPGSLQDADFLDVRQDNVANFLLAAQYNAIVPGRQDFLYGSARLAELAYHLRTYSRDQLHMLAANLRFKKVSSQSGKQPSGGGNERPCPLLFGASNDNPANLYAADNCTPGFKFMKKGQNAAGSWDGAGYKIVTVGGKRVLIVGVVDQDLLTEVATANKRFLVTPAQQQQYEVFVSDPEDEVRAVLRYVETVDTNPETITLKVLLAQMPRSKAEDLAANLRSNPLCQSAEKTVAPEVTCNPVGFDMVISQADESHATGEQTSTITVDPPGSGAEYVVTPHPAYSNVIRDLVRPLSQLSIGHDQDGKPQFINKAQWMTAWKEGQLKSPSKTSNALPVHPALLVNFVSSARLSSQGQAAPAQGPVPPVQGAEKQFQDWRAWVCPGAWCLSSNEFNIGSDDLNSAGMTNREFVMRTMLSLQLRTGADVVLLQRRDFFFDNVVFSDANCVGLVGAGQSTCKLRNEFERILWKRDNLATTALTGKQIKNLLSTAKKLSDNEDTLSSSPSRQEWLVTFGVWKPGKNNGASPSPLDSDLGEFQVPDNDNCHIDQLPGAGDEPQYCVDGRQIDDSAVYRVATSDHLASGSDVYPDFKTPVVIKAEDTYKEGQKPASVAENVLLAWHMASQRLAADPEHPERGDLREYRQQERGFLHYQLQKLTMSFNEYSPNRSDLDLGQHFSGVSDSRAVTPHSSSIDFEENFRMLWESRLYDFGFVSSLSYKKDRTGSTTGAADSVKYSQNQYSIGPVLQLHLGGPLWLGKAFKPRWFSKILPAYKLVISPYLISGQVQGNRLAFADDKSITTANPPKSLSLQNVFNANVQWNTSQRVGFRHEFHGGGHFFPDKNSFYEVGYQWSFQHDLLTGIKLLNPGNAIVSNQSLPCTISATQSLTDCVKALQQANKSTDVIVGPNTAITGIYTNHPAYTRGTYWTGSMNFPLLTTTKISPVAALLEGSGDFFNDLGNSEHFPTQTRLDVSTSLGLQLPIWGNLSAVPKYTLFLYENQIARDWLKSDSATIELRWSFDRNSSIGPKVALGYKSPNNTNSSSSDKNSSK